MTHADIHAMSEIKHWRQTLDDIAEMLDQISDTTYTVMSQPFDLAGRHHHTEPPLPGGDRLDATGPWASDANAEGCDPTPRQVIIEWDQTIRWQRAGSDQPPAQRRFTIALRFLRDEMPTILESPHAGHLTTDLRTVHGRLQRLCPPEVDHTHDSRRPTEPVDLAAIAHQIPDDSMLTRDAVEHFYPGQLTTTGWAALRKRAQRARAAGSDIPHGHYPITWIREHTNDTPTSLSTSA